jgi:hypothetical protein
MKLNAYGQKYWNLEEPTEKQLITLEGLAMTDDIVTRLRNVTYGVESVVYHAIMDSIDEIERLRATNTELIKMFKQVNVVAEIWQKTEDELIELHHGKCADQFAEQFDEIERLRELLWKYENCEMVRESPCDIDWEGGECETCDKHRKAVRGD